MRNSFEPKDLLLLDKMLVPKIITVLYWIGIICCLLAGMFQLLIDGSLQYGIAIIVFGPLCIRLYAEIIIIMFKIYEKLSIIADNKENRDE